MEIRKCTPEDVQSLVKVLRNSYVESYTWLWHDLGVGYMEANFNEQKLIAEMSVPNSFYFLLYDEGLPVGALKLNLESHPEESKRQNTIELERIYLVKAASGKGYGRLAVEFAENFGLDKGKALICLKAMKASKAVLFYQKLGFIHIGDYFLDLPLIKKEFSEMVILEKKISPAVTPL